MEQSRNLDKERNIVKQYWISDLTRVEVQTVQGYPESGKLRYINY